MRISLPNRTSRLGRPSSPCMAHAQALLLGLMLLIASRAYGQCSRWVPGAFDLSSPNAEVNDMLTFDLDGGGPQPARLIAATNDGVWVWDTVNWRPMGVESNLGQVNALTIFNGSLVAGGVSNVSSLASVVRWNGNGWIQMGASLGAINALAVFQGELIAGGEIFGGTNVARWDGSAWQPLGADIEVPIKALTVFDLDGSGPLPVQLIASGYSIEHPPLPEPWYIIPFLATWNGSNWFGADAPFGMNDFVVFNGELYACGFSRSAVTIGQSACLSRWDSHNWVTELCLHDSDVSEWRMQSMAVWNGGLVVVGRFDYPGSDNVLRYDGTDSSPLVGGQPGSGLNATCVFGPNLAVAATLSGVAQCNGVFWVPVDSSGFGNAFATLGSRLVAGGNFTRKVVESGVQRQAYNIVGWAGFAPSRVAGGTNGPVHALEGFVSGSDQLVVGGSFTRVGEGIEAMNVNNIALRTEPLLIAGTWSPMGTGFNAPVLAIDRAPATQVLDVTIYAGGEFTAAGSGSPTFGRIAQWTGSPGAWSAMGNGFNGRVRAIKAYNSGAVGRIIVAGGDFTIAGSVSANRIASWATPAIPASAWSAMGSGFNGSVHAIERFNFATYAAGAFTASGATTVNRMARWTGTAWVPVGNGIGFNNTVRALLVHDGFLYAVGDFTSVDGIPAEGIARWDGSVWSDVGLNNDVPILALASFRGEVHAGIASDDTSLRYLANSPWIAQQPQSQNVSCGQTATFLVIPAPGYSPLTFTWRKDGVPLTEGPTGHGSLIDIIANGVTITNVRGLDAGVYDCVISAAGCGSVTSGSPTLTVLGTCPPCPADTNADGVVNVADLLAVISAWGPCSPPPVCAADNNLSGAVDVSDLLAVIMAWGACP